MKRGLFLAGLPPLFVVVACQGEIVSRHPPSAGVGGSVATGGFGSSGGSGAAGDGTTGGSAGLRVIDPTPCEPTLDSIKSVIIEPSCAGDDCHGSTRPAVRLSLTVDDLESILVNVSSTCNGWALVVPGSPEQSFLHQKIMQSMPPCEGDRMPLDAVLPDNQVECVAGWIQSLAPSGCEKCGGENCVSLSSDPLNCGTCQNACPTGTSCIDGVCACPGGQRACGGACVDSMTDSANCGACGIVCAAGSSCSGGACACSGSLESCSGSCVDITSDAAHCGDCTTACDPGQVCLDSVCSSNCGTLTQCGSSCADLATSAIHCGDCDSPCDAPRLCMDGSCSCPDAQTLCGNVCVDTQTDRANCGTCGTTCGPGSSCAGGTCQCDAADVSFANEVQPIFTANCNDAGCHAGARPKEGLSLEVGKAYAALVDAATSQCNGGRTLVVPGDVGRSYLMNKLLGTDLCTGSQMPKAGQSLSGEDLATISNWICQGAPDN